jgi:hypothetical protein
VRPLFTELCHHEHLLTGAPTHSLRAMAIVANVLGRAGQRGQARRFRAASKGSVTWENPVEVAKFMKLDAMAKAAELAKAMEEKEANRNA